MNNLFLPVILTNNFKKRFCCFSMLYLVLLCLVLRVTETVPFFVTPRRFCAPRTSREVLPKTNVFLRGLWLFGKKKILVRVVAIEN